MKHVLITGANRGIGFELTAQFAARGDQVFAGCRAPDRAAALEALMDHHPGQVIILPLDVVDPVSLAAAVALVAEQTPALDLLINNAAINMGDEGLSEVRPEDLLRVLEVNAVGPVIVAQHFRDLIVKGSQPVIVNISSESGSISTMTRFRGYGYYGSKAAENMYTRALALDPEMEGVTVIAMHPGWVRTDMGGPNARLSTTESAAGILRVIDGVTPGHNGRFFTWEGTEYPW